MRHWLIALALLPSLALAGGPKYTYPGVRGLDDEMNNAYHDIRNVPNGIYAASSMTLQGLTVDSVTVRSTLFYLQNATQTIVNNSASTTGNTFTTTNLSANITPTSATSRIKITLSANAFIAASTGINCLFSLWRGTPAPNTNLNIGTNAAFARIRSAAGQLTTADLHFTFIDSPATTSAISYMVRFRNDDNATSCTFGSSEDQLMILEEIK